MVAVGVGTIWIGYYIAVYGYCLIRGYDVSFADLMHSTWPGAQVSNTPTPGQVVPKGGHKLGTIFGHVNTTNPGQATGT